MDKNSTGKYLKYAIGEILLVVIGILLAVQINNWNQNYKNEQLANVFLIDFQRDLEKDIQTLDSRIGNNNLMSSYIDSIFTTLATRNQLSKEEVLTFWMQHKSLANESYFIPEKGTIRQFETGTSSQLILSKALKVKLFSYYSENDRNEMNGEKSLQLYQHIFLNKGIIQPLLKEEVLNMYAGASFGRDKLNLDELRQNSDYMWSLGTKKENTASQTNRYEGIRALAKELMGMIALELK